MAKRLHVEPAALDEVENARRTVNESRGLGDDLLNAFEGATVLIRKAPLAVAPFKRSSSGLVVRRKKIRRFRYHVVFVDLPGVVWVIAFSHERQSPDYWLSRVDNPPPA